MKNPYYIEGNEVHIEIYSKDIKLKTIIDLEDLEKVKSHEGRWYAWYSKDNDSYYVCGWKYKDNGNVKTFYMHRFLYDEPKGLLIDHINHDTLNNTRENTRVVTHAQNQNNKKNPNKSIGRSKVRNVYWCSFAKKWRARFTYMKSNYDLGRFDTIEEASEAIQNKKKTLK